MLTPAYYRRQALTCLSLARATRDCELSRRLVDMATRFLGKAALCPGDQLARSPTDFISVKPGGNLNTG
jgi:hypothetical protein